MNCTLEFEDAPEDDENAVASKNELQRAYFVCESTVGAKIAKCRRQMIYDDFLIHVYKHHNQNQYNC